MDMNDKRNKKNRDNWVTAQPVKDTILNC